MKGHIYNKTESLFCGGESVSHDLGFKPPGFYLWNHTDLES